MKDLRTLWDIGEESFRSLLETHLARRHAALPGDQVTVEETAMPMPGDDLIPAPDRVLMRATNIDAPADDVWPWLAQMMRGGGIYGWPRLESERCASAAQLLDRLPPPHIGDRVDDLFELADVDAPHCIVWRSCRRLTVLGVSIETLTLSYQLTALNARRCRLLARQRCVLNHKADRMSRKFSNLIHFLLPCSQLRCIKYHAESSAVLGDAGRVCSNGVRHQAAPFIAARQRSD